MSKIYKAALYMRISNSDERTGESESLGNQRKFLQDFVEKNSDIQIICEHLDDGVTGLVYDRPAFNELMRDILAEKIDCVICKDECVIITQTRKKPVVKGFSRDLTRSYLFKVA